MKQLRQVTAIIEREGNGYVSLCPELDVASQGDTIESARNNYGRPLSYFLKLQIQRKSNGVDIPSCL